MAKRSQAQIEKDNEKSNQLQIKFLKETIEELQTEFNENNFKIIWSRNIENWDNDYYSKYYKTIDLIFEITINNKTLKIYTVLKSNNNWKYQFARDRSTDNGLFQSLRKISKFNENKIIYDRNSCKQLIKAIENEKFNILKLGYIKTIDFAENNPEERNSDIYYRNKNIVLGNLHNLLAYINEIT